MPLGGQTDQTPQYLTLSQVLGLVPHVDPARIRQLYDAGWQVVQYAGNTTPFGPPGLTDPFTQTIRVAGTPEALPGILAHELVHGTQMGTTGNILQQFFNAVPQAISGVGDNPLTNPWAIGQSALASLLPQSILGGASPGVTPGSIQHGAQFLNEFLPYGADPTNRTNRAVLNFLYPRFVGAEPTRVRSTTPSFNVPTTAPAPASLRISAGIGDRVFGGGATGAGAPVSKRDFPFMGKGVVRRQAAVRKVLTPTRRGVD